MNEWSMRPQSLNCTMSNGLAVYRNSMWKLEIGIVERESTTGEETPFPMDGYTGVCEIKRWTNSEDVVARPTVTIDNDRALITISMTDDETLALPVSDKKTYDDVSVFQWDCYVISEQGDRYRLLHGELECSPNVYEEEE